THLQFGRSGCSGCRYDATSRAARTRRHRPRPALRFDVRVLACVSYSADQPRMPPATSFDCDAVHTDRLADGVTPGSAIPAYGLASVLVLRPNGRGGGAGQHLPRSAAFL